MQNILYTKKTRKNLFCFVAVNAKVILPPENPYPDILKDMCTSKFSSLFKNYNNDLALANFTTKLINISGKGPQVVRVYGQIYHNISSLYPSKDNKIQNYGQLRIIESNVANKNYYVKLILMYIYKMMYEVECEPNNNQKLGIPQLDIRIIYTHDSTHNKKSII